MLLEAVSIAKSFAGVRALKGVSFHLLAGEVHALIGENGAGKSTLIKIMTGAVAADSGELRLDGRTVTHNSPALSRELGIAAIYQQPSLFPHLTVAENIALALENNKPLRRVDWRERNRRASELLARTGAGIDPERPASELSMPEQQMVEIAKALGARARVVIMDEPTASLTEREVQSLFQVIRSLRSEGAGVIYISHRLEEVSALADRITVLRDGESVATRPAAETDRAEMIRLMVGREMTAVFPKREVPIGAVALEVRDLGNHANGLRNISLAVRSGEILGVAGLVGSGRTQLAETLFGLTPADEGEILIQGRPVRVDGPARAIKLGVGFVPEDRRRHGVILEFPISSNISLANLAAVSGRGLIRAPAEKELARGYAARFAIKAPSTDTETGALSGGNQQKVALARWLATQPRVLILDEPTQGVDVGAKAEIHSLIVELAAQGLAILMISSDLPEILGMSDRVAVMRGGGLAAVLERSEATQQSILSHAFGQSPC